ncbi:MAG: hypothetical protein IJT49_10080 [Clostridia bacterium]|nr:hypothetical protein [Clostridia bacterium]
MSLFGKKFKLDYGYQRDLYKRAKDGYRAGSHVKLYYCAVGTDTDYSFYLNDQRLNPLYSDRHGYIIKFKMPDHDSKLQCRSVNSMFYMENGQKENENI